MFDLTKEPSKEKKPYLNNMDLPEAFFMLYVATEA
jgi:hypothetical protein